MYKTKDILLTGFALFAMLFGAGNLIFPPMLGYETNSSWIPTMLAFIITGVGFPFLGILSVSIAGNGIKVYLFDGVRSTPELSFAVRELKAQAPTKETVDAFLQKAVSAKFCRVLEYAGVFKQTKEGQEAFSAFMHEFTK